MHTTVKYSIFFFIFKTNVVKMSVSILYLLVISNIGTKSFKHYRKMLKIFYNHL